MIGKDDANKTRLRWILRNWRPLENASIQDSDAESSPFFLQMILFWKKSEESASLGLSSEDFYIPSNQIIFEQIKSLLFDNNKPVDVISLADHSRAQVFERWRSWSCLAELGNNPLAMVAKNHAVMRPKDITCLKTLVL